MSASAAAWLAVQLEPTPSGVLSWYSVALLLAAGLGGVGYLFRQIQWPGRLFIASLSLTGVTYLAVVLRVTFAGGLPLLGILLSSVLLTLELAAILLTMVFAFEMADALCRDTTEPDTSPGSSRYRPRVCLQVPAYNEPPELVRQTLEALARLDYPDYLVQVVVNNTTDPLLWRPVEEACAELGERFQFIHLPRWPGFKAGALNEATRRLGREVEVVAIVDADYLVAPDFLSACIPLMADPEVAFLQTPQHYREWRDSPYLRGLFHAYRYFFDVTMVSRARTNAIIFGGTMGLIRLSVLKEIGGWAEWCITEDAEASLRILAKGWKAVYLNRPFGEGLMPLDFDGLRRQRFRWAFGGIQILRRHFGLLVGRTPSRLSGAQRYHYLVGGLGWFGDLVGVGLGLFMLVAAPLIVFGHVLLLRQLTGAVLVLPLFLLVSGLVRLGWALKVATEARWRDVPFAMVVMLALGMTVAQACLRGLYQARGVFLRTPKAKSPSRLGRAVLTTWLETVLAAASLVMLPVVVLLGPRPLSLVLGVLLGWQVIAWGSAPGASLLAQGIRLTPTRVVFRRSPQNRGGRPRSWPVSGRALALGPAVAVAAFIVLVPAVATSGGDDQVIAKALSQNGLGALPALASGTSPAPSGAPSPVPQPSQSGGAGGVAGSPSPIPSGAPSPSTSPAPSPGPTAQPTPTAAPTPTASPTAHPTAAPTSVPSPTGHPTPSPR